MFIEMVCDPENQPSLVDTPQPEFKSSSVRGKVGSLCVILVPNAAQRMKLFRTVMSKK
jgi:hypothetical protein